MTPKQVKERLMPIFTSVVYRRGVFIARCNFLHEGWRISKDFADTVQMLLPEATITVYGTVRKPPRKDFDMSRSNGSHYWVRFIL